MVHRKWDGLGRYLLGSGATWLLPLVAEAPWERLRGISTGLKSSNLAKYFLQDMGKRNLNRLSSSVFHFYRF